HDRFAQQRAAGNTQSQFLLQPRALELTARQSAALDERLAHLRELGFELERFGSQAWLLRSVPALKGANDLAAIVPDVIDESLEETDSGWQERLLASLSCRAAVKSGRHLSVSEHRELLTQLATTQIPLTCPHGSPIVVTFSREQLEHQFSRRLPKQ
ncbi:MAG: hypothetical protein HY329_24330, partial [Chloroflexi bacterium]|nr:hypothetical protein [Chloroflexota bacterium]